MHISKTKIDNFVIIVQYLLQDDPEDLSFKKGDILEVLRKDEEEWWFAKHEDGRQGSIPVPYVQIVSLLLLVTMT